MGSGARASASHSLNLMWSYPEFQGYEKLWNQMSKFAGSYLEICAYFSVQSDSSIIPGLGQYDPKSIQIEAQSADSLLHISDNTVDIVVTDPPYYSTIQYAELSDFFYVWQKRTFSMFGKNAH